MDTYLSSLFKGVKGDDEVPTRERGKSEHSSSGDVGASSPRCDPFYPTQIRHGVFRFKSDNGSPFFAFEFLGGKVLISHCENLHDRFELWSGSLAAETACGPFVF
jgi:hypothetical protein